MQPVEPTGLPGMRIVLAKTQPQYKDLVARKDREGVVYTRWQLDEDERGAILDGACIELITWTFNQPFSPIHLRIQGIEKRVEAEK